MNPLFLAMTCPLYSFIILSNYHCINEVDLKSLMVSKLCTQWKSTLCTQMLQTATLVENFQAGRVDYFYYENFEAIWICWLLFLQPSCGQSKMACDKRFAQCSIDLPCFYERQVLMRPPPAVQCLGVSRLQTGLLTSNLNVPPPEPAVRMADIRRIFGGFPWCQGWDR